MSGLNRALPKWLRFSTDEQVRLEGFRGDKFTRGNADSFLQNRSRFGMKLEAASWLRFEFQGLDARLWYRDAKPHVPPFKDTFDLRLAFVEIGGGENPVAVRFGRQELFFGEERLLGAAFWTNTGRSFDAVRATYKKPGVRIDAFASSVVVLRDGDVGDHQPGNNLHGVYTAFDKVIPNATFEPYVYWRLNQRLKTEHGTKGDLDFFTYGLRWVGKMPANFDYNIDMALQRGSLGTDKIAAWAGHWVLCRKLDGPWKPRLLTEYNYASGDNDPKDGRHQTFDQLYPTGHEKYGINDQVGWRNVHHARNGIEFIPHLKWTLYVKHSAFWLANARDALYSATSAIVVPPVRDGSAGRFVGNEIDVVGSYRFRNSFCSAVDTDICFRGSF